MDTREADRRKGGDQPRPYWSLQCPDDNILLAYTRHQNIENLPSIRQHIQGCQSCQKQCDEYEGLNATLAILASVQDNLTYPEPLAYEVLHVIRGGKRHRRKKQTSTLPIPSVRVAFTPIALLVTLGTLILVTAVGAFALTHTGKSIPSGSNQPGGGLRSSTVTVARNHSAPRPKPTLPALLPTPIVDPTPTVPYIELCTTPGNPTNWIIRICGHNFTPGDHIVLVMKMQGSPKLKQIPAGVVDAQGNFQDAFILNNCKVPEAVFAKDLNNQVSTNLLQNFPVGNCS